MGMTCCQFSSLAIYDHFRSRSRLRKWELRPHAISRATNGSGRRKLTIMFFICGICVPIAIRTWRRSLRGRCEPISRRTSAQGTGRMSKYRLLHFNHVLRHKANRYVSYLLFFKQVPNRHLQPARNSLYCVQRRGSPFPARSDSCRTEQSRSGPQRLPGTGRPSA